MLPIIGGIISGLMGSSASRSAANTQAQSAGAQLDFNKQVYADQTANFAPWQQMGLQGQQAYNSLLGLGQAPEGFQGYQQSPGYQFQMQQGLDAAQSSAAAQGGLMSGKTLRDMNTYGQGVANQDYQTYLNRLQGVGAQGQAAAGMQSNAAGQYGANGMNALGSMGDARAAGTVGAANAWTGGINNAIAGLGYMQANGQQGQGNAINLFGGKGWGGFG
jgi:hypothetical protein